MDNKIINKGQSYKLALYLVTIIFSVVFLYFGNKIATKDLVDIDNLVKSEILKVKVEEILDKNVEAYNIDDNSSVESKQITFNAEILSGKDKGKLVEAVQVIDGHIAGDIIEIKEGDKALLIDSGMESNKWQFMEFVRTDKLIILGVLFIIVLLIFGRKKGFNTILSLFFTCIAIFAVFVPSIVSGKNIYFSSVIICLYTIVMTLLIVNGFNKKTLTAMIGCSGGVIISGFMTLIMNKVLFLTGIVNEESIYLTYLPVPIDLKAVIFAGIIIGAMGAIMDVAMSISSSLWEVKEKAKSTTFDELFKSGMNIGRDMMGTMTNTLILAYIGSSLAVVLLLSVYNTSLLSLLNMEMIIVEILQALIGSFGILFTMPLTSAVCAIIYIKGIKNIYAK